MNKYDIYSNSRKLEKIICKLENENNTNRLDYDIPNQQPIQTYISNEYDILHEIITNDLLDKCSCDKPYHSFNITKPTDTCFTLIPKKDIVKIYKNFNKPNFKFLDLDIINYYNSNDLENLYDIIYYKKNYYLIEYSILIIYETKEKIENYLLLPFLNFLNNDDDIESYLDLASNNFNCVMGVNIFTIPNNIKKPKKYGYCVDDINILCYYKINNDFIKNVINSIFIKKKPKYNDDYLINLFNENKVVKRKKKRIIKPIENIIKLDIENTIKLNKNENTINLKNTIKLENTIKVKNNIKVENNIIKQKIFKLEFYYYENDKDFYINLFDDLYNTNNNFKQMIIIFDVKNIIIYKPINKSYTNDIYINCCINNINYHAYLNNDKKKIIRLT